MAQGYATGPCDVWCGIGQGGAPVFLGHSESGFRLRYRPQWEDLRSDLAGKVPYDRSYMGFDGVLSGTLTRWNMGVYAALACYVAPALAFAGGNPLAVPGAEPALSRGALMLTQGLAYTTWLRYPNVAAPAMAASLPAGYRNLACILEGPDELEPGAKPYKIGLVWYCFSVWLPALNTFQVYDNNMAALPAGIPN